jgi:hypothetical protein
MYACILSPFLEIASMPFVYLVGSNGVDGPIKIGYTAYPAALRLGSLQTGNPFRLKIIETFEYPEAEMARSTEKTLHSRFASKKLVGEWFSVSAFDVVKEVLKLDPSIPWFTSDKDSPFRELVPTEEERKEMDLHE